MARTTGRWSEEARGRCAIAFAQADSLWSMELRRKPPKHGPYNGAVVGGGARAVRDCFRAGGLALEHGIASQASKTWPVQRGGGRRRRAGGARLLSRRRTRSGAWNCVASLQNMARTTGRWSEEARGRCAIAFAQ